MSELLRELEEDIRSERMHMLWSKFGKTMIRVSIAVIIGTALGVAWKHYQQSQAKTHTSELLAGFEKMQQGDFKAAMIVFDDVAKNGGIYADIALLQKAQAQAAESDDSGAEKTYQTLDKRNSDSVFALMGKLMVAKETDTPLTVNPKAPFVALQNETRGWQLLAAGKKDDAIKIFATLRDDKNTPQTQRVRMTMALSTLSPDSLVDEIMPKADVKE